MLKSLKYGAPLKRTTTRSITLAGPVLAVTCGLAIGTTPAFAIEGVHRVDAPSSTNSSSPKTKTAECPLNERVIGGGGWAEDTNPSEHRLALTQLQPEHFVDVDGTLDSYTVSAAETAPTSLGWSVTAYAICAKPIAGLNIQPNTPPASPSSPMQATAAGCPAGQRVIGSGARSSDISGRIVLQVARPSHPGDIARAQAQVRGGYAGSWSVTAYAICAPTPSGYEVVFDESQQRGSENVKIAGNPPTAGCPSGKRLLSSGAAISSVAPSTVSLHGIRPLVAERRTQAVAVANVPTNDWDFIVATSVCAY